MTVELRQGDNRVSLQRMIDNGEFVDSVVTDPPYGLVSVTKRFGGATAAPAKFGTDGAFQRQSAGFMSSKWDGTGIERDPEFWRLVWEVMKPGAYIAAFSSSRTYGYMQVAMEQAGFITHPMTGWVFGSGLAKPHRVEDPAWEGWGYGAQSEKPALEPIYRGQKPFSEKTGTANILKHGVGALHLEACRLPSEPGRPLVVSNRRSGNNTYSDGLHGSRAVPGGTDIGRGCSNLIHDGSSEVLAMFPDSKGQLAKASTSDTLRAGQNVYGEMTRGSTGQEPRGDSGSAARFFTVCVPDEDPVIYAPKANKRDRAGSKHPTVKPISLQRELVKRLTPPGGLCLDPFAGTGTTGQAALNEGMRCILMEAEREYARDIRKRFLMPETLSDRLFNLTEAL